MIVHLSSRMRDFFFPDELMYLYADGVNQCSFSFIMCMSSFFRQTITRNGIWTKLMLGTGIWYTPLQDRLIILLLSYISTRNVVQIAQLLNNSDTHF